VHIRSIMYNIYNTIYVYLLFNICIKIDGWISYVNLIPFTQNIKPSLVFNLEF